MNLALAFARSNVYELVKKPHGIGISVMSSKKCERQVRTRDASRCEIALRIA
jgi:hypothetical protein